MSGWVVNRDRQEGRPRNVGALSVMSALPLDELVSISDRGECLNVDVGGSCSRTSLVYYRSNRWEPKVTPNARRPMSEEPFRSRGNNERAAVGCVQKGLIPVYVWGWGRGEGTREEGRSAGYWSNPTLPALRRAFPGGGLGGERW